MRWVLASLYLCVACGSSPEVRESSEVPAQPGEVGLESPAGGASTTAATDRETPTSDDPPAPFAIRISLEHEQAIDEAVARALAAGTAPGAVVLVGGPSGGVFERAYGSASIEPEVRPMTVDARFDLASVTKVFTTLAILRLVDLGRLSLEDDVAPAIPELAGRTIEDLLRHRAGLQAVNPLSDYDQDRGASLSRAFRSALDGPPGTTRYSDMGFVALGELVSRSMAQPLREAMASLVTEPLQSGADFRPNPAGGGNTPLPDDPRIVPTERAPRRGTPPPIIEGEVNDPRAWRLGGVAGHAGLFASARDLASMASALLQPGFLSESTWRAMQVEQGERGLGVDMQRRPFGSGEGFGHGGYTGTWFWVDPAAGFYVVLLTNRVHPDGHRRGDLGRLRNQLGRIAAEAVPNALPTPSAMLFGVDVLRQDDFEPLHGKRVALFTNRSGVARDGLSTRALLHAHPHVELVRLFAPEHGLDANREGRIGDGSLEGIPVVGLFGRDRDPPAGSLDDVDALVVDIQDVGARFYTYAATLHRLLVAASGTQTHVLLLDRPNPLGGEVVAGPVVQDERRTFINHFALPVQHGMTLGELATLIVQEEGLDVSLQVVRVRGWRRAQTWRDIGLRWVPPSPNLRRLEAVELYPGVALIEAMDISVGRGTDRPFEQFGAPWLDPVAMSASLEARPQVFAPVSFRPTSSRHRGQVCQGLSISGAEHPVELGIAMLAALVANHREQLDFRASRGLVADDRVLDALIAGESPSAVQSAWQSDLDAFRARRAAVLLYEGSGPDSPQD